MELHPAGENALLAEVRDTAEALALAAWARVHLAARDVVPAARTVLLDGVPDTHAVAERLREWGGPGRTDAAPGPLVEIPVTYDGPDLEAVAELWGTDPDGVVARHGSVEFVSAFCGFAPGFAYLSGLPPSLAVPRLETPRERVPAGSVGLADTWCGVYPTASPGGWRLLGRTDAVLWDEAADPPGAAGSGNPGQVPGRLRHSRVRGRMTHSLTVRSVSGLALTQDHGRPGYAHLGVPRAGALDPAAADLADRLVGSAPDVAVIELTMGALTITLSDSRWVAVTGARCPVTIDGQPVGHGRAEWVPTGAELALGMPADGARSYLAVGGGVAVPPVLGSRSTDTLAWVGPAPITEGAELPLGEGAGHPTPLDVPPPERRTGILRVEPGPRADWFAADALDRLCGTTYAMLPASNRVGLRLDGPPLPRVRDDELPSEGMVLGSVQVPPDGRPVVFLADHPTTGGYPVLAVVRAADLGQCAQLRPGDLVRFSRA